MERISYKSLEAYLNSRIPDLSFQNPVINDVTKYSQGDRSGARSERQRLLRTCHRLEINLSMFKSKTKRNYVITPAVVELFTYLLDYFESENYEHMKAGRLNLIPIESYLPPEMFYAAH